MNISDINKIIIDAMIKHDRPIVNTDELIINMENACYKKCCLPLMCVYHYASGFCPDENITRLYMYVIAANMIFDGQY